MSSEDNDSLGDGLVRIVVVPESNNDGVDESSPMEVGTDKKCTLATDTPTLSKNIKPHRYVVCRIFVDFSIRYLLSPKLIFCLLSNSSNLVIEPPVTNYLDIKLADELWVARIQDSGVEEDCLPRKRYKMSKIISIGSNEEDMLFYYDLTSIAVDYVKHMKLKNTDKTGWLKLPVNLPNVKKKIVETIVAMRILVNNKYHYDQDRLVNQLHGMWGNDNVSVSVHPNDKLRLFGLIMSIEENRPLFERLACGATERYQLDDASLSLAAIFRKLSFQFGNEDIVITLPPNAPDVQGIENIDPNDKLRMLIERDGKLYFIANY